MHIVSFKGKSLNALNPEVKHIPLTSKVCRKHIYLFILTLYSFLYSYSETTDGEGTITLSNIFNDCY